MCLQGIFRKTLSRPSIFQHYRLARPSSSNQRIFQRYIARSALGQRNSDYHKELYDRSLRESKLDFHYVVFEFKSEEFMQLSGLLYPEYDFDGNHLQNIASVSPPNQLITYFTAPTVAGWAFCFAWHVSSHQVCEAIIRSFAATCRRGNDDSAALLRFVFPPVKITPSRFHGGTAFL